MATNGNVLIKVYETLLCSPGMNEQVKIDFHSIIILKLSTI